MNLEPLIPIFSPGIAWYAKRVLKGDPFSLVRYGGGEWKTIIPDLPDWRKKKRSSSKPPSPLREMWELPVSREIFRDSFLITPRASNYFPAIWHQPGLRARRWLPHVKAFLAQHDLEDLAWHDGDVFRQAVKMDKMDRMITALRSQPLPIILIGPDYLFPLGGYLPIEGYIQTHAMLSPLEDVEPLARKILACPRPAIFAFSCAIVGKILIQRLFSRMGEESFLIDFGSTWDGYCEVRSRGYHKSLTPERIQLALEGR